MAPLKLNANLPATVQLNFLLARATCSVHEANGEPGSLMLNRLPQMPAKSRIFTLDYIAPP